MTNQIKRNLPSAVETELAIDFTRPVYLVKMLFTGSIVHVSSNIQIVFDSDTYIEGQVAVGSFTWNANGAQQGRIILSNEGNSASALILGGTINDVPIEIYKTYLISGGGNTAPQLWVKGVMNGSKVGASRSSIDVLSTTASTSFIPSRYHTVAEGHNWLPVDGEVITWGEELFLLRAQQ